MPLITIFYFNDVYLCIFSVYCFHLAVTIGMDQNEVIVIEDIGIIMLCASVMMGSLQRTAVVSIIYQDRGAISKSMKEYLACTSLLWLPPIISLVNGFIIIFIITLSVHARQGYNCHSVCHTLSLEIPDIQLLISTIVTVYRKTGHNAAPFKKIFFTLTELSASRY